MRRQQGFASVVVIGLIFGAVGFALWALRIAEDSRIEQERISAAATHLREYVFGVQKFISEQGLAVTTGTFTGASWLQDGSCPSGTASSPYIASCAYEGTSPYGATYSTTISVSGSTVEAVTTVPWPRPRSRTEPVIASRIITAAIGSTTASTPVAQTFADYELDVANETIVVTNTTAVSTDIWWRTDGSNQMNADGNLGGNAIYNVSAFYGGSTAADDLATTIRIGSAVNIAGVLDVEDVDAQGYSIVAPGSLSVLDGDFLGRVVVGDEVNPAEIQFADGLVDSAENIRLISDNGDLLVTNDNGTATLIADAVYVPSVNRFLDQAVYNITMVSHGDFVEAPVCRPGLTPQIFHATNGVASEEGRPLRGFTVDPIPSAGGWTIQFSILTDGPGLVDPVDVLGEAMVVVKCS